MSRAGAHAKGPRIRVVTAARFREARLSCVLSLEGAAKLLHVSVRTVHNWESGAVRVPYAAYRLMRILRGGHLFDPAWQGFRLRGGRLWTPEGHGLHPGDLSWLSLLCRQAEEFRRLVRERRQPHATATEAARPAPGPGASQAPAMPAPLAAVQVAAVASWTWQPEPIASQNIQIGASLAPLRHHAVDFSPVEPGESGSAEGPASNTGQKPGASEIRATGVPR
jgi:transcriptional regulator with XRE-family HTH domain